VLRRNPSLRRLARKPLSVRELFGRLNATFVPARPADVSAAIKAGNEARNALRDAAYLTEQIDPKLAQRMLKAADEIAYGVRRMWSL
jgi:hypothetical protein